MKKTRIVELMIIALLIIIALFSFTKCITITCYPAYSPMFPDTKIPDPIVTLSRYMPGFVCVLTGVQLLLLWKFKSRPTCWFGILLNIIATAGPYIHMVLPNYIAKLFESITYDYVETTYTFEFSFLFYLIIVLGIAVTVLYFLLFCFRKNPKPNSSPEYEDDTLTLTL